MSVAQRPPWIDERLRHLPRRPWRKIHLDFHNSRHIPRIGDGFDAVEFGDRRRDARVALRPGGPFRRAHTATDGAALPLRSLDEGWEVVVPRMECCAVIAVEYQPPVADRRTAGRPESGGAPR